MLAHSRSPSKVSFHTKSYMKYSSVGQYSRIRYRHVYHILILDLLIYCFTGSNVFVLPSSDCGDCGKKSNTYPAPAPNKDGSLPQKFKTSFLGGQIAEGYALKDSVSIHPTGDPNSGFSVRHSIHSTLAATLKNYLM